MNPTPQAKHRITVYTSKYHTVAGTLLRMGYKPRRTRIGYTGQHHKGETRAA